MNPTLTIFLFAMSLLAIASAAALMIYIHNELQRNRQPEEDEPDNQLPPRPRESTEVVRLLSRMKESTLVTGTAPRRKPDSDYDRN